MDINREKFWGALVGGIQGSVIGDALGVPVEFMHREALRKNPVVGMMSGGIHEQTIGTWSDDTSMTLCTMESLIDNGIDYDAQMARFSDWLRYGTNTAHNEVFDVGGATRQSIFRFVRGMTALECGELAEYTCGNGSLMRIFPTVMYIIGQYGNIPINDNAINIIHNTSKCTHQHARCLMACGIFYSVVVALLNGVNLQNSIMSGIVEGLEYYKSKPEFVDEYENFKFLLNLEKWTEDDVRSSGYVIDTLQASLWCLYRSSTYSQCVLSAVNLGEDTDTTGAVAGAIAGLWYKEEQIPIDWIAKTVKYDSIYQLSQRFFYACVKSIGQ